MILEPDAQGMISEPRKDCAVVDSKSGMLTGFFAPRRGYLAGQSG